MQPDEDPGGHEVMGGLGVRRRPGRWLPLLMLVGTLLGGCAGPDPATEETASALPRYYDISELVAAVAERQRADGTARLSLSGEVAGRSSTLRFAGEGVLRLEGRGVSARFTQTVAQGDAAPQETGFVVLPGEVYLRQPAGPDAVAGKPWARVDPTSSDPADQQRAVLAATLTANADPTTNLARYADATLIADASDDQVDGVPTVRYTIVVDLARAAVLQPDPALRAQLEQQVRDGLTRITSTLWVDGAHRPVRSDIRQELPGIGTLALTAGYRDWGQPVDITPPPAAQVR
ncbi:hypothetical protein ACVGVM_05360 [Pseudonocardia bannensis]|uniref:Lipoprotein n=1 Tax=Pseudonocardia bannensis TaxID=630973 RepID=A0A848DQK0_9PSEU|nr:hypothetical protein [Pseudonocardia bannensis]NMH94716.1 hypothetical protein [Pseudonocardia bannensis]